MKKYFVIAAASLMILSCNKQLDTALKSADKEYILKTANDFYAKKKWADAIALYERLPNLVAGTDDAPEVVFKTAFANYYDKNYKLAGHQFKNFAVTFPQDPRKEEAAYMSALCYYEDSMDYNLDQTSTESAINEMQDFINNYPDSERAKNIAKLVDELSYKLEFKAYEHARQYFKMAEYKSSAIAFENVLNDYPSTKLKPKIYDFIMKSKYHLGMNSVYDLKKDRIENALAFSRQLEKEYPNTPSSKEAVEMREKLLREKEKHEALIKQVEAKRAEILAKQKAEEEKQKAIEEAKSTK